MTFAAGYHPEVLGEYAALKESRQRLWTTGALCLLGVLLLVWIEFRSRRITALVGVSLPFALVGASSRSRSPVGCCRWDRSWASSR